MRHSATTARKMVLAAEIRPAELALRIFEAIHQMKRPAGLSAEQAMSQLMPEDRDAFLRAAKVAAIYLRDVVNAGRAVQ